LTLVGQYLVLIRNITVPQLVEQVATPAAPITKTKPDQDQILGALKELQTMEVLVIPSTQTYTTTLDRGKVLWTIDNEVTQKHLVSANTYYLQDYSTLQIVDINWETSTAKVAMPNITTRVEIVSKEILTNKNSLNWSQDIVLTTEESAMIEADLSSQVKLNLELQAPNYLGKAEVASDLAVQNILKQFNLTLKK
jgi:rRNA maturation endonuclease Nob1